MVHDKLKLIIVQFHLNKKQKTLLINNTSHKNKQMNSINCFYVILSVDKLDIVKISKNFLSTIQTCKFQTLKEKILVMIE